MERQHSRGAAWKEFGKPEGERGVRWRGYQEDDERQQRFPLTGLTYGLEGVLHSSCPFSSVGVNICFSASMSIYREGCAFEHQVRVLDVRIPLRHVCLSMIYLEHF